MICISAKLKNWITMLFCKWNYHLFLVGCSCKNEKNSDLASQFAIEFIEATSSPREPPSIYTTNILIKDLVHLVDGVYWINITPCLALTRLNPLRRDPLWKSGQQNHSALKSLLIFYHPDNWTELFTPRKKYKINFDSPLLSPTSAMIFDIISVILHSR